MRSLGEKAKEALVVDDEPEYLDFVAEYLRGKELSVVWTKNLPDALKEVHSSKYRLVLVDMNIPALSALTPAMRKRAPLVDKYPGIAVAIACRTLGYGAHSVIAYTVHDDDAADAELTKMNCRYVLKGRPEVLKRVIDSALAGRRRYR